MRVHHLRVTAFGPFAGTAAVDLDALAAGGLFLLHGPTGAGKTSVLDAVCFALYGSVPGGRQGGRLRSDHAAPGVAPEVVCEFSASGRRLEVTRSPAWERPKRRGTGTTLEQAHVVLRELRDGVWTAVTNRVDEAAAVLDDVLGLGADQFTKLVLLPQGDFAAFLRADAETRRHLLERLFGTDRFTAVQQWLRESQAGLRQQVEAAQLTVARLVARADQAAATAGSSAAADVSATAAANGATGAAPRGLTTGDPTDDPDEDPLARVRVLRAGVEAALDEARARRVVAQERARRAVTDHATAVRVAGLQARSQGLRQQAVRLRESAAAQADRQAALAGATRAAGMTRWLGPLDTARSRSRSAQTALDAALVAYAAADGSHIAAPAPDDDELDARRQAALHLVGELRAVERQAADAARLEAELDALRERATTAAATRDAAAARLDRHDEQLHRLLDELAAERGAAAHEPVARAGVERADEVLRSAQEAVEHERRAGDLAATAARRREERDVARERWLDLRERRLRGMAAELARRLAEGHPCPVCGGVEHPAPAPPLAGGGVDEAAEALAEQALTTAQEGLTACEAELSRARALAAACAQASGGAEVALATRLRDAARHELAAAVSAAGRASELASSVPRHESDRAAAVARRDEAEAAVSDLADGLTRLEQRCQDLRRHVDEARAGHADVSARRVGAERTARAADGLLAARRGLDAATRHLAEVTSAARAAAEDAGFEDLAAACAAVLPASTVARLEREHRAHDQEAAVVTAALADPDLAAAAAAEPAQPGALAVVAELAQDDDEAAAALLDRCSTAATAVAALEAELRAHLAATAPLLERYRLEAELARCLDGTGGDNALRMSLSSYVLAARLEQVAAAASERLQVMSGGRYALVHCDEAERGRGRSGLALRVVDGWTGRQRDTASLSGGESFYTSLALALGLADVVTAEAGGASVETLFVDEGFGSLDDDTLGEVMDVLDALRSGGRVVGLVSHVADLRDRIPARLEVVRTREGSTLRQATA